jgi:hypothetical protein
MHVTARQLLKDYNLSVLFTEALKWESKLHDPHVVVGCCFMGSSLWFCVCVFLVCFTCATLFEKFILP